MSKQLSEAQIREVITELGKNQVKLTGSVVRAELRRRCGSPGGVSRVYRLLQDIQKKATSHDHHELVAENTKLRIKLGEASRRVELAEQREEAHQVRWAMEIDLLRQQLREASVDRRLVTQLQDQVLELRRIIHRLNSGSTE